MKKFFLAVTFTSLCSVSSIAPASDRSIATAWAGMTEAVATLAKSRLARDAKSAIASVVATLPSPNGEAAAWPISALLQESGASAKVGACPICPFPPCE